MTFISKNVYIDKLDNLVVISNNTFHSTVKMKPVELKSDTYIDSSNKNNDKDRKVTIHDFVRISKYKIFFAKGYAPNWSEEVFLIKKDKKLKILWTYVINNLNGEETVGTLYKEKLEITNQKGFRNEKVIKKKDDNLYVKWKGYNDLFNSWVDKKDTM